MGPGVLSRLATALLLGAVAGGASAVPSGLQGVERHVLPNGLVLLLLEDHSQPLVSVGVMYRAGAKHEAAGTTGLAHYCEHMNFRATRGLPGGEITEAITRLGGRWSGYTWIDQTWYAETVPKQALERVLDLERERMTEALYDPADFQKERTSVLAELRSYDDPRALLYDAVLLASFGVHPYRNNTIGWPPDVQAVTRDEAYAFYKRYYHPNNAVLVAAGDLDPARTLELVRARFGALPADGASTELRSAEPEQTGQRRITLRQPGPHARVLLAFRAPALADAEFAVMVLFDALLAGGKGLVFDGEYAPPADTPLERALVTSGLATRASSSFQASRDPYVFTLGADVPASGSLEAAERALFDTLAAAAVRDWTPAELAAARLQVRRGLAQDHDELRGRAHQLAFFEVSGGYEHLLAFPGALERVTAADVRAFAGRRLRPEQATVGWFEPAPAAPPEPALRSLAPSTGGAQAGTGAQSQARVAEREPTPKHVGGLSSAIEQSFTAPSGLSVTLASGVGSGLVSVRLRLDAGAAYGEAAPLVAEWLAEPAPGEAAGLPGIVVRLHDAPGDAANTRFLELLADGLEEDLPGLLASLAARLARALPSDAAFLKLRQSALARVREHEADAELALLARARRELFGAAVLAQPAWGTEASLARASARQLADFVAARVGPRRARLAIAGQFDVARTRALVEASLATWVAPASASPLPVLARPRSPAAWSERRITVAGKSQDDALVVWPGDRSRPHDRAATAVLLYLLGETGYAGRLGRALVEPGLVYWVGATLEETDGVPGCLAVRTASAPSDTPEVLRRIRAILAQAQAGGFTQAELDEARTYLRGKRLRAQAASASRASLLVETLHDDRALAALTVAQLNDTARRLGSRGAPVALVAGP